MYFKVVYNSDMEEYFSLKEISSILKVHIVTVRRWVAKGKLSAYLLDKDYRIKKSDFDKFIAERRVKV